MKLPTINFSFRRTVIFSIPLLILLTILILSFVGEGSQQFSDLAQAFLRGHLNFLSPIGGLGQDPVLYHGKEYWDEGPFPAVLLMPFVGLFNTFHAFFYQNYLQGFLVIGVLYFVFKLARILSYSNEDGLILTLGFALGSVFIGVASVSSSWFFAQVLTTFLLFWSLYEFYTRKRWWLIGLICGLVLMTRITAAPILIFFGLELWQTIRAKAQRFIRLVQLCLPVIVAGGLLGLYNFLRFHDPFNAGYAYQLLETDSAESRSLGVTSLVHIPTNLYHALLGAPQTVLRNKTSWTLKFPYIQNNPDGLSIFFTSPYLLSLFTHKWSTFNSQARHLLIAALVSCVFVLSSFAIGKEQFGYRYTLDFLPELFLLFMIMYRKRHQSLSVGIKVLLIGSGLVNFYLLWSFL